MYDAMLIMNEAGLTRPLWALANSDNSRFVSPRGLKTIELENFQYTLAPYVRFNPYVERNLSMSYIKREFEWYVNADVYDLSILKHAKIWANCVKDGKLNSCYGKYWFRNPGGVANIVNILRNDPDSRRAVIPMYGTDDSHIEIDANDVPCTLLVEFRVREGRLTSRFTMRSQDAVLGMGSDVPTFSLLTEVVATLLGLDLGEMTVSVGSFHVYERHFELMRTLIRSSNIVDVPPAPRMTLADAAAIRDCTQPQGTEFATWLHA